MSMQKQHKLGSDNLAKTKTYSVTTSKRFSW